MPSMLSPEGISLDQMSLVLGVSRMLAVTADLDPLMRKMAEAVTALLDCERASIFLHDPRADQLWTKVAIGTQREIRLPAGAGVVGAAFRAGAALHVPQPYEDARFNRDVDRQSGFVTRNLLAAPMFDIQQKPVGVIQAVNKTLQFGDGFRDADIAMLQLLADQAGVALQRYHLQQAAVRSMALEREMELARAVQQAMTPAADALPTVPGLESAGWTKPASINGGDCFDIWRRPDGRLGVLLADASGHGLAPALVVSQVRTLVRTLCESEPDPYRVLWRINSRLYEDLPSGRFVTAFVGYVASDGAIDWCSAGHGPTLIKPSPKAPITELEATVPPLGVLPELPEACRSTSHLRDGGWLIVTSDGLTEAGSAATGELYGTERLLSAIASPPPSPRQLIDTLRHEMISWQGSEEPTDDQTVVAVRRGEGLRDLELRV